VKNLYNLKGKYAVITGGAGLLGKQHARALLDLECEVELWDIDENKLKMTAADLRSEFNDYSINCRVVDITNEKEIVEAVKDLVVQNCVIDILVNNAAINPKFESKMNPDLRDYPIELWNLEISVGLTGAMSCSRIIGSHMAENGNGVILNIASDLSAIAPDQRIYRKSEKYQTGDYLKPVSYSVIKTGLIGLTRYLATYWADFGVRVNALSPGGIYENQDPEFVSKLQKLIPLGRMAKKDEYIGAVQFLCSDASSYLSGHNLIMDGGRSIW